MMKKLFFVLTCFCLLLPSLARAETKVQHVRSTGGIEAWLVQEKSVPIIAISFAFVGGASQDPNGKAGLTQFMTGLLDEGAGSYDSRSFQEKLQALAISLSFSLDRDYISGTLQTLSANRETAFDLLRLALNEPRFDADAVERVRGQIYSVLRNQANNIEMQSALAFSAAAFPNHPYGVPKMGTEDSVGKISRDDIVAAHKKLLAQDNLKISVVGDIGADELAKKLDMIFGELPKKAELTAVPDIVLQNAGKRIVVPKDGPQTNIQFGQIAPKRRDTDFMAAYILNHMLGGSSFSSRLYKEIREKRGLTYGVYTDIATLDHAALFAGAMATKNETAGESVHLIEAEIARFVKDGPTPQELAETKSFLIGFYPLQFATTTKIASMLLGLQLDGLGSDYLTKREDLINAVTIEDVKRVAQKIFKDPLLIVVAGKPKGVEGN